MKRYLVLVTAQLGFFLLCGYGVYSLIRVPEPQGWWKSLPEGNRKEACRNCAKTSNTEQCGICLRGDK